MNFEFCGQLFLVVSLPNFIFIHFFDIRLKYDFLVGFLNFVLLINRPYLYLLWIDLSSDENTSRGA
jgi:hypothetical protein